MKVSIVIPTYNVEQYILDCVQSVSAQTYSGDIECILVDDCGTDNTIKIVHDYIDNYRGSVDFVIISHTENKGVSASRNTGVINSTGDYILFLDSDDILENNCLETLVNNVGNCECVVGNYRYIDHPEMQLHINDAIYDNTGDITDTYKSNWYPTVWNMLFKKSFVIDNDLFFKEGLLHEDELWTFNVACVAKSMRVMPNITYNYRIREKSIMTSMTLKNHIKYYTQVLREEVQLVHKYGLESNHNLYNIIEDNKRWRIREARKVLSINQLFCYYSDLRKLHFSCNGEKKWSSIIRDLHYRVPYLFGFIYLLFIVILTSPRGDNNS